MPLGSFWTTPGMTDERMHAFVATGLKEVGQNLEETSDFACGVDHQNLHPGLGAGHIHALDGLAGGGDGGAANTLTVLAEVAAARGLSGVWHHARPLHAHVGPSQMLGKEAGDMVVVHSAVDNLLKGASGQAVQNMNLVFGLDETAGLKLKSIVF